MTQESRKKKDETIAKNCGNCIHNKVCQFKGGFDSAVSRVIHEVQADDYLVDISVNCKYHADKYGLSKKERFPITDRDKLIELISRLPSSAEYEKYNSLEFAEHIADHLLANGVIVTPCIAMVERFIKDGEFDKKLTAHNGRIAVVYIDKSKWNSPLIDITEQFYNTDKAEERIQALKEDGKNGL